MLQQHSLFLLLLIIVTTCCKNPTLHKVIIDNDYSKEIYYQDRDSLKQGLYIELSKSGDTLSKAYYLNNKLHGDRTFYYTNGKVESIEKYEHDILHGPEITYFSNGNIQTKGNFTNGILDSLFYSYYETGELKEKITIHENMENGPFWEFYKNGVVHWEGTFLDGDNEVGLLTEYDEKGEVIKKMDCGKYKGTYICQTIWDKERGNIEPKFIYEE